MNLINFKKLNGQFFGIVVATLLIGSGQASAALTQADWKVAGDGAITRDTITNLEWLDVSISVNQSFNYVSTQFDSAGLYSGFRYATGEEIATLFTNAGLNFTYSNTAEDVSKVNSFISLVGSTYTDPWRNSLSTNGISFQTPFDFNPYYGGGVYQTSYARVETQVDDYGCGPTCIYYTASTSNYRGAWPIDVAQYDTGSWLVRVAQVSPVPAPAAVWLFAAGLPMVGAFARRRKQQA